MTSVDAQLAAAQAAAAAIVHGDDEKITPSAVAPPEAPGAASAEAASAHRTSQGLYIAGQGAGNALDLHVRQVLSGLDDEDKVGGDDDEEERAAAAAGARPFRHPVVKRLRRDWKVSASPTAHPAADILASDAAVNLAEAVIIANDGVTMLRKALVIGKKAVAVAWSWRRTRLCLPW